MEHYPDIEQYFLESNFATDKKSSQVNILRTRGKRVVAEATIPDALLQHGMGSSSELLFRAREVANLGGFMAGVNNNGAHSANGITAIFIATGQDAANVAESSAALIYAEHRPNGDFHYSVTIPSLIVATYGGDGAAHATGVPRDPRLLRSGQGPQAGGDRRRHGPVRRDIAGSAIVSEESVKAHDLFGRNRP